MNERNVNQLDTERRKEREEKAREVKQAMEDKGRIQWRKGTRRFEYW